MARILIIDDSAFARSITAEVLGSHGNEIIEAESGQDGIKKAERERPDCILLDLLMPEIDGFDVLKALRSKGLSIAK